MKVSIYCIVDKHGIPLYIGKTKNSLSMRESQTQRRLKEEVFIFELDSVENEEWKFWECYWIEQFISWGFKLKNKNKGGGGPEYHPKEVREKMSNTPRPTTSKKLKGKKRPDVSKRIKNSVFSLETNKKISEAKKGHECYNNERTEKIKKSNEKHYKSGSERNKKISKSNVGRKNTHITILRSISVVQLDKQSNYIQEFESGVKAGESLNKPSSAISECCSGKRKSAYGYIWMYKEEYVH